MNPLPPYNGSTHIGETVVNLNQTLEEPTNTR